MFVDAACALRSIGKTKDGNEDMGRASHRLGRRQLAAQERVGVARFALLALDRDNIVPLSEPERRIDESIAAAQGLGLREVEDIVFYVLNVFTLGAAWSAHPSAAEAIRRVVAEPTLRLAASLGELPDDVLEEIATHAAKP